MSGASLFVGLLPKIYTIQFVAFDPKCKNIWIQNREGRGVQGNCIDNWAKLYSKIHRDESCSIGNGAIDRVGMELFIVFFLAFPGAIRRAETVSVLLYRRKHSHTLFHTLSHIHTIADTHTYTHQHLVDSLTFITDCCVCCCCCIC